VKLFALAFVLVAGADPSKPVGPAEAEQVLVSATSFDDVAVGYEGTTPAVVHAFRALLKAPDGATRFGTVLERAGPAGQLYALCGLFFLDPAAFDERIARLRGRRAPLERMDGCIKTRTTLREMLAREKRAPLMSHAGTAEDWRRRPYPKRQDIAGGSVCYRLRFDKATEEAAAEHR